ncbi:unnamed protein product, partial [Gulo gulo]
SESSTQHRSEEQKLPPGGPQADRQAQGPGKSLLDPRKGLPAPWPPRPEWVLPATDGPREEARTQSS